MNKYSILHISDLHKADEDTYVNLLSSLQLEKTSYSKENLTLPSYIVVSGDIVKGSLDPIELERQYNEVKIFLENLVSLFLDGDALRLIMVPGNHDVDWGISVKSMEKLNYDNDEEIRKLLKKNKRDYRWSWKDLSLYRIQDENSYNERFNAFKKFYDEFYLKKQSYQLDPNMQVTIHDFEKDQLTFVGFNSCFKNDHLNDKGLINPQCIAAIESELTSLKNKGRLIIGVWHHHTIGYPGDTNYLDTRVLTALMDRGVKLGLYGHQHIGGVLHQLNNVIDKKSILLFSSGSLYGNWELLPSGAKRQYNLIEITKQSKIKYQVRINVREDRSSDYAIPAWGKGRIEGTNVDSFLSEITLDFSSNNNMNLILNEVMREVEITKNYLVGVERLLELEQQNALTQKLIIEFLEKSENNKKILEVIEIPQTPKELILILNAAIELNDEDKIRQVLTLDITTRTEDPSVKHLINYAQSILKYKP